MRWRDWSYLSISLLPYAKGKDMVTTTVLSNFRPMTTLTTTDDIAHHVYIILPINLVNRDISGTFMISSQERVCHATQQAAGPNSVLNK